MKRDGGPGDGSGPSISCGSRPTSMPTARDCVPGRRIPDCNRRIGTELSRQSWNLSDLQVNRDLLPPQRSIPASHPCATALLNVTRLNSSRQQFSRQAGAPKYAKPPLHRPLSMGRLGLHWCRMRTSTHGKSKVPSANHQSASDPYRTVITAVVHRHFCVKCTQTLRR